MYLEPAALAWWAVCGLAITSVVRSVYDDDPVLRSHLEEEGPGWRAFPFTTECEEQETRLSDFCQVLIAKNKGCVNTNQHIHTISMLSYCRRECRTLYQNLSKHDLDDEISDRGGLADLLPQPFGFQLPVCSLTEGYSHGTASTPRQVDYVKGVTNVKRFAPTFTEKGYLKTKAPDQLYRDILAFRKAALDSGLIDTEEKDLGIINSPAVIENPLLEKSKQILVNRTQIIPLDVNIKEKIFRRLGPLAEQWADLKLSATFIYGIRRYRNMSSLVAHLDRFNTHVISAIINVGQEVEEDWPLYLLDNTGQEQVVVMEPGDLVWYESARVIHGRQKPLRGEFYDNLFIHFKPQGLWYTTEVVSEEEPVSKISAEAVRWSQRNYKDTDWTIQAFPELLEHKNSV